MDVQRLRVLRELADRGSVTAVATALSFTPSAVSQQLKTLAQEVGLPLTEPAGRGLRLTDAGLALVAEAEAVLTALARAEATVERLRTTPRGDVRIAMFPSAARMLLPGLLHRLAAVPELGLHCRDVDLIPAALPVLTADFDIVVSHRDETAPQPPTERWLVVPLLREPLDVVLPPGHPLADRESVRPDDVVGEPWIGVEAGWPFDDVLRTLALGTGHTPRVVQRINELSVTAELVAAGHGIALLPRYSTHDRSDIVRRPLVGVRAARLVEAVLRISVAERPAVSTVLDALRAEADAVVARG